MKQSDTSLGRDELLEEINHLHCRWKSQISTNTFLDKICPY